MDIGQAFKTGGVIITSSKVKTYIFNTKFLFKDWPNTSFGHLKFDKNIGLVF